MRKSKAEKAYESITAHRMNCAQSVLTTFCEETGLDEDLAMRAAWAFGGGMGQSGGTCGAVTGAYMALGMTLERSGDYMKDRAKMSGAMDELRKRFKELHGSLSCTELSGYDLSIPAQAAEAREKGVFVSICPGLVRDAARILEDILTKQ